MSLSPLGKGSGDKFKKCVSDWAILMQHCVVTKHHSALKGIELVQKRFAFRAKGHRLLPPLNMRLGFHLGEA